jgi:hypothetical protein
MGETVEIIGDRGTRSKYRPNCYRAYTDEIDKKTRKSARPENEAGI